MDANTQTMHGHCNAKDFAVHQTRKRQQLLDLLGDLPEPRPPSARLLGTEKHEGYEIQNLELELNGLEQVPAHLLMPERRSVPAPGLLYIHAHGGTYELGKEELTLGRKILPAYAPVCAAKGLVTLAIDSWCFSGRKHQEDGQEGEWDTFKRMLWQGQVLWGMMLFDEIQALNYLTSRPEVDRNRVGVLGLSMGATKAWWLAALDPRISLCIDLCCLTDYQELIRTQNLRGHGIYYYVPQLLKYFESKDINELIAPRPRLSLNGRHDALTPPAGVDKIRDHLQPLYAQHGRCEDCHIELFDCGHEETPEMRQLVLEWLDRYLVASPGVRSPANS